MIFYLDASAVVAPLRSRVTAADFIARLTRKHKNRTIALFGVILLFFIAKIA